MKGMKKTILVLVFIQLLFTSCNKFEKRFFNSLEESQKNAIKKGTDTFNLSTVTDFEWDSVMLIRGNESVPIFKEQIEEDINNHISSINWEERRFSDYVDPMLIHKTTDLPTYRHRFYFHTPDNKIVEKQIKYENGVYFSIEYCLDDSIKGNKWLSKEDCKFLVRTNSRTVGEGSLYLYPNCE